MGAFSLALDMHGGDFGLPCMAKALAESMDSLPENCEIVLCGRKKEIESILSEKGLAPWRESGRIFVEDAEPYSITGRASRFCRNNPRSSLVRAVTLQKEGRVNLTLSAGDTGALYSSSVFLLGREEGIERPALGATFPTPGKGVILLLDVGANLKCRASHLVDFAYLGHSWRRRITGDPTAGVALLNVGREEYKGTEQVRGAHNMLKEAGDLPYAGFIEGNRVLTGDAGVVVCDGFTGNAILKLSEGIFRFVNREFAEGFNRQGREKLQLFDADLYGAVPILGIRGNVYKAHGGSSVTAVVNALTTAVKTLYL
ncbi:MAG: phosphate acyltransferase [Fibrobacterota bacterium]